MSKELDELENSFVPHEDCYRIKDKLLVVLRNLERNLAIKKVRGKSTGRPATLIGAVDGKIAVVYDDNGQLALADVWDYEGVEHEPNWKGICVQAVNATGEKCEPERVVEAIRKLKEKLRSVERENGDLVARMATVRRAING